MILESYQYVMVLRKSLHILKMDYNIEEGLLKENSLSARIYFLLHKRELGVSDISKVIYGGDIVQLSNVQKAVDKLSSKEYVEEIRLTNLEKEKKGIDKRVKPYRSTYKPLIEYIVKQVAWRNGTSRERNREDITEEDKIVLNLIFNSKWFSKFYSEEFLITQRGEITIAKNKEIISPCPIRFFAFFLEEIFEISLILNQVSNIKALNKDIIDTQDFDKYLENNKNEINKKTLEKIKKITSLAIKSLGYYKQKSPFDFYTNDIGVLFIPQNLAQKLRSIGRIPATVSNHYQIALNTIVNK